MSARTHRFFNPAEDPVAQMLEGFARAHTETVRLEGGMIVRAEPKSSGKVGLVIGNGSGHEPAMIGWVGEGLLDVNVPGPVFSSPGPARIACGIRAADRGSGVLLMVSNHSGDVMNSGAALHQVRSSGVTDVEMVVLYDDVASAPSGRESDRRGGAGLFFVWKMVGAAAEAGMTIGECVGVAQRSRDRTRSIAAASGSVAHPISGEIIGRNEPGSVIVGIGVHGESGTAFDANDGIDRIIDYMIERLLDDIGPDLGSGVALLVNNSGSLTMMETSIVHLAAARALEGRGIDVERTWNGRYVTTQDLAGFSLAICALDDELRDLYDAPANGASFQMRGPT